MQTTHISIGQKQTNKTKKGGERVWWKCFKTSNKEGEPHM